MFEVAQRADVDRAVTEKNTGIAECFAKASYVGSEVVDRLAPVMALTQAPQLGAAPSGPGMGAGSSSSPMTHYAGQDAQGSDSGDAE